MAEVVQGDKLPAFEMAASGTGTVKNSDFVGKTWVLFFYPKDDTPGCTKEAIDFTSHLSDFDAAGVSILGVSKDTLAKHEKFITKHDLGVQLASDEGDFCERMGVWVEKKMYGKTYFGIERATFLIGPDGSVSHVWRKVKVPGHVEAVLDVVKS